MATFVSASSGNNSATYACSPDASLDSAAWSQLSSIANTRIKALLDTVYTDGATTAQEQFAAAAAAAGLTQSMVSVGADAPAASWTCASGARPVLTFAAALTGHVRLSLSYSASA